jgi:transposase
VRSAGRKRAKCADCFLQFLPTYSYDFNPIELLFSPLKAHLAKAGEGNEPGADVHSVYDAMKFLTADMARAAFAHCGYV